METINLPSIKRVALINDMSCFGKCSLTVSQPIISAYGIEAVPLPTAILSTHTGGFSGFTLLDMTEEMEKISAHWKSCDIHFDAIYTGYFCNERQVEFAEKFIREFKRENTLIIVDPVLGDNGKLYVGFDEKTVKAMKRLIKLADVITPNYTEAVFLSNSDFGISAEELLEKFGNKYIAVTGVKNGDKIGYAVKTPNKRFNIEKPYRDVVLHGSGDVFASVLTAEMMNGKEFSDAVTNAADFCDRAVEITEKNAKDGTYGLMFEKVLSERINNSGDVK